MTAVEVNGLTIEYETRGSGEPVLLIMGLGAQLSHWPDDLMGALVAHGYQVITFDNRDVGLSSRCPFPVPGPVRLVVGGMLGRPASAGYHIGDMAADAAELLGALDIESAHVVGMSMGGMIAQHLAFAHPHLVRSLTSVMSRPGDLRSGRMTARLFATMTRMDPVTPDNAVEASVETMRILAGDDFDEAEMQVLAERSMARSFGDAGVTRQTAAIYDSPDRTAQLARITAPTLVIHGLLDQLVQPSGGVATARAIPDSRLIMYPGMGHYLPRHRWIEVLDAFEFNVERGRRRLTTPTRG